MTLFLILAANFAVGICIGLTGIAGFLLPMFYSGFLGMGSAVSLAYSFSAFLISGILGSVNYKKSGNLDLKTGVYLSAGKLSRRTSRSAPKSSDPGTYHQTDPVSGCSGVRHFHPGTHKKHFKIRAGRRQFSETASADAALYSAWFIYRICLRSFRRRRSRSCNAAADLPWFSCTHSHRHCPI